MAAQAPPADPASTAISARMELGAAGCALTGGLLAAAAGPLVTFSVLGVLLGLGVVAAAAYRPVFATYAYLGALPFVAGLEPTNLLPLVRPAEALLALLLAGALFGGVLRYFRGQRVGVRLHRLDVALAGFVLLSTAWPLVSLMLRGQPPRITEMVAVLPICTLAAIYLLVRFTVATERQLLRCVRLVVWPAAVVVVIAILQALQFGTATLASPIAVGDYLVIGLVLVACCGARGLLGRREGPALGFVLGTGVLAAGQVSTWIGAAVAGGLVLWRLPELRRRAVRLLWVVPIAVAVGALAVIVRWGGPASHGGTVSPLGRLDGPSTFSVPGFGLLDVLIGVSPDPSLDAPERWREAIALEGYLQLLWIGGLPLLVAFGWLSVTVLCRARELTGRPGSVGATAAALQICWWFLLVVTALDPHLTLRETGDLLFLMLAITTGRLCAARDEVEAAPGRATGMLGNLGPWPHGRPTAPISGGAPAPSDVAGG